MQLQSNRKWKCNLWLNTKNEKYIGMSLTVIDQSGKVEYEPEKLGPTKELQKRKRSYGNFMMI